MNAAKSQGIGGMLSVFAGRIDDKLNPIVIKELRQAVQGRFVSGVLLLFLAVALVCIGVSLLGDDEFHIDPNRGRDAFFAMYVVLLATCMLFIPILAAVRMVSERSAENIDLLYVTTLKAGAIIRGKIYSAMVLTIIIFSVCMPFMTLTYLLRGIDLPTIVILMALALLSILTAVVFAILLAALPGTKLLRGLVGLIGAIGLIYLFAGVMAMAVGMVHFGFASAINTWEFWGVAATILVLTVSALGMMGACAKACIMPPSANRALSIRIWVTLTCLVGFAVATGWAWHYNDEDVLLGSALCAMPLLSLAMLCSVSEREQVGPRLARSIPRSPLARVAAFLFYSGSAGGVLWCLILMLATVILPFVVNAGLTPRSYGYSYSRNIFMEIMTVVAGIGLYTICYSLTAVHIRRAWLSRWIKPKFTWALVLLIFAVLIIVPLLIHLLLFREGFYRMDDSGLFLGTPFLLGSRDMQGASLAFSGLWAIVMGIAALPWLVRQMERFRPLKPTPAPASPPPVAQATVVNPDE